MSTKQKFAGLTRRDLLLTAIAAGATLPAAFRASNAFASDKKLVVGFSIWDLSIPFAVPLADALRKTAEKNNIDLKLVEAKFDASVQAQHVAEFIVQGVDVICVTPVDVRGILPAAKSAKDKGIPFIACLGTVEGYPYIGADDVEYGRQMARLIIEALATSKQAGPYNIAFLRGSAGGSPDRLRYQGIMEIVGQRKDIKVVGEIVTDWSPDKGLSGVQDLLQKFPVGQLHLVHGWGGMVEVPGARYAHKTAGRTEVIFTGGELTHQTKEAIENGWEYGVVIAYPSFIGAVVMNAVPRMAPTFDVVPADAVVPLPLCTKANVADFTPF